MLKNKVEQYFNKKIRPNRSNENFNFKKTNQIYFYACRRAYLNDRYKADLFKNLEIQNKIHVLKII